MKTKQIKILPLLILVVALILLAACNSADQDAERDTAPGQVTQQIAQPTGSLDKKPTDPPAEAAPSQPDEEVAEVTSETQDDETASKESGPDFASEDMHINAFFDTSWREIMLRDPEWVLSEGMADIYGLEGAELTDISDEYIRETYRLYEDVLEKLHTYNRDQLTPEQQVSYDVYKWFLEDQLRQEQFMYHDYPATFFPITSVNEGIIYFFSDLHPIKNGQDARDYVTRLGQVDEKMAQLFDGLELREEMGIVPPQFALQWALYGLRNIANSPAVSTPFYQALEHKTSLLSDLHPDDRATLLTEAQDIIQKEILMAYQELLQILEKQERTAPDRVGVWQHEAGDDYYDSRLRHYTTTEMSADEIHQLGLRELDRIHTEMRLLFDELGYPTDQTLIELFDRVADGSGNLSGDQVIATYESLIEEADQNLDDAFDLRPQTDVVVINSPIKGMYVSASRDGSRPGTFHAGPANTTEQIYAMPTLAYHEAVPGHHYQIALAQEADLPLFRNMIGFSGYSEGWALYAEQLAAELGWYKDDPYGNLGRLQAEAFRAARLVVDPGIHAKGWSFEEAEQYFSENTGFDSKDSVPPQGQIARYSVWPAQSTSYKIGMIKILELRQRAMDKLGENFDLKEFHSVVLRNGSMPLEVLERVIDNYISEKLGNQ